MDVRDQDSVAVSPSEKAVVVWHIYDGAAFDAVLVTNVESDVVFYVEFPESFVVLEWEA